MVRSGVDLARMMLDRNGSERYVVASLEADLNRVLGELWCIHGFTTVASVEVVQGRTVQVTIAVRCYECKQTFSLPAGLRTTVDTILGEHSHSLEELGLAWLLNIAYVRI
jgi:hypothetical protein